MSAVNLYALHESAKAMSAEDWIEAWAQHADANPTPVPLPPFPEEDTQKITNSISGSATMRNAGKLYRILEEEIDNHLPSRPVRILDYGAGWGRVTRLMLRTSPPEMISAVDVDKRLVDAGRETLAPVDFRLIDSGGRLPYADDTFDLIFANSVFSHLSEDMHLSTLRELSRILRPNGLFIGTTLSREHAENWFKSDAQRDWIRKLLGEQDEVTRRLESGEFVFGSSNRWPGYGLTILPEGWTRENWPRAGFDVIDTRDDYFQIMNMARPAA